MKSFYLQFWEVQILVDIENTRLHRDIPVKKAELTPISQLQSVISVKPQVISCGGCSVDVLKALDQDPVRQDGSQYPFSSEPVDIKKVVCGASCAVLGGFDSFSLLQTLLVRLTGVPDEKWMHATTHFRQVSHQYFQGMVMTF